MKKIMRVANLSIGKKNYKKKIIQIKDHNYKVNDYFGSERFKKNKHNNEQIKQIAIKNKKFGVF